MLFVVQSLPSPVKMSKTNTGLPACQVIEFDWQAKN
jgi:hypothetical protein